jgi:hypothetical protein
MERLGLAINWVGITLLVPKTLRKCDKNVFLADLKVGRIAGCVFLEILYLLQFTCTEVDVG